MTETTRPVVLWVSLVSIGLSLGTVASVLHLATPYAALALTVVFTAIVSSRLGVLHRTGESLTADELGIYPEAALLGELDAEIARSRRYGHEFAVVLVSIAPEALRFDYTDKDRPALRSMTESLLTTTRQRVDKIFRCSSDQFGLILPESNPESVSGMVRRIRRLGYPVDIDPLSARAVPLVFGATFYPSRATDSNGLARRARLALALARKAPNSIHLDCAEAESLPPVETQRRAS